MKHILRALVVIAVLLTGVAEVTAQPNTRVAVTAFENKVKMPLPDASWTIGEGLAEILTTESVKTGQFIVARAVRTGAPSFSVVKVEETMAYINAGGASSNVRVGDVFQVYSRGEELVDPDTGLKLGNTDRLIGSIRVTEVQEQFSIGVIQNTTGAVKRRDRVR